MNKKLFLSLVLLGTGVSTNASLHATDDHVISCSDDVSSEMLRTENKSFEKHIVKTIDKNLSKTISNINNKLKEEGKTFWATSEEWSSSINSLKWLIAKAKDINSTTDEERNLNYSKLIKLFKQNILQNLAQETEDGLNKANSAVATYMVYLGLFKRFHDERFKHNDDDCIDIDKYLFSYIVGDLREDLEKDTVFSNSKSFNAWQLLCGNNSGEGAFIGSLRNDWYCYLTQLNVISFGDFWNQSTATKVDKYEHFVSELLRKCAGRIGVKDTSYLDTTNMPISKVMEDKENFESDAWNNIRSEYKRQYLYDRGYTSSQERCVNTIRKFEQTDAQFNKHFANFNALRIKKSLPGLTKDVFDVEYLKFMREYLDFLERSDRFKVVDLGNAVSKWLFKLNSSDCKDVQGFTGRRLEGLIEHCQDLNDGDFNDNIVSDAIDLLFDLINLAPKYKIEMSISTAVMLAPVIQRCNVKVDDFLKKINAKEWNNPDAYQSVEEDLTTQALIEIFYNRQLSKKEKDLIHKKVSGFQIAADWRYSFETVVKFLLDCVAYKIDFLKILPDLAATFRSIKHDLHFVDYVCEKGSRGLREESSMRRETLYKFCPKKFDELFRNVQVGVKNELKRKLDNVSTKPSCKAWSNRSFDERKRSYEKEYFFPKRIVTPATKIKHEYRFINSNK